jgi:hypothetical protein
LGVTKIVFCKCGDAVVGAPDERCYKCMKRAPEDPEHGPPDKGPHVSAAVLSEDENSMFWGAFTCWSAICCTFGFLLGWIVKGLFA